MPGELIVGFKPSATQWQEKRAVEKARGEIAERIDSVDAAVVTVDPDQTRRSATPAAQPRGRVRRAELRDAGQPDPQRPSFAEQWGLRNLGHFGGKSGADIGATVAWDAVTSSTTTVAVVDTGVSYKHPDLIGNAWTNAADPVNGLDDDGDGFDDDVYGADFIENDSNPDDDGGHGTHVAGIIGAQGNNAIGITGVTGT